MTKHQVVHSITKKYHKEGLWEECIAWLSQQEHPKQFDILPHNPRREKAGELEPAKT